MIDPNIVRWIKSSFTTHFQNALVGMNFWVENEDRNIQNLQSNIQFRLDGPNIRELTKNFYEIMVDVNILITRAINKSDLYGIERDIGKVTTGFTITIPIYKLGDGTLDDQSILECMIRYNEIEIKNFGQIDANVTVFQSTVAAGYKMHYDNN